MNKISQWLVGPATYEVMQQTLQASAHFKMSKNPETRVNEQSDDATPPWCEDNSVPTIGSLPTVNEFWRYSL